MIHKHENWFRFSYIMNIKHSYCSEQCMHVHEGQIKEIVKIMFLDHQMNSTNPLIICS